MNVLKVLAGGRITLPIDWLSQEQVQEGDFIGVEKSGASLRVFKVEIKEKK